MWLSKIANSRFTIAAILLIAFFQFRTLRTQDDFVGQPRWKSGGVIQWDVKEYYMYLPATFIYGDPAMKFLDTMKGLEREHYWAGKSPSGNWVGRFSLGMSIFYSPFFFVADAFARISGQPQTGYSVPYQFALYISGFIYSLVGFIFLALVLKKFFDDKVTAITLLCIGLGTNLFYYTTTEGAMTHAVLFCLCAIFLYNTIRWHQTPKLKYILGLCFAFGLIVLIRPTNIIIGLFFLLYGVYDRETLKLKINLFQKYFLHIISGLLLLILMALPQLIYWKAQTGNFIYYSYSGEHFFFDHPRIWKGLFSFRKGWLLYTPMAGLALAGFVFLKKYARPLLIPLYLYTFLNIWIVLSWWCWWYGGGFGLRAFIESYVFLSIPLASLCAWTFRKGWVAIIPFFILVGFFIRLNLFQSRQYREGMLHWDSISKELYIKNFMKLGYVPNADKIIDPPDYDAARRGEDETRR